MSAPAQLTKSIPMASIPREAAAALIAACLAAAKEIGMEVAVAVTDATGSLWAFERTDGAPFLTTDVAIDKAWTASSYGYPTHVWNQYVGDPKVAPLAYHPRLLAVGGGYQIMESDRLIGGVGISARGNETSARLCPYHGFGRLGSDPECWL